MTYCFIAINIYIPIGIECIAKPLTCHLSWREFKFVVSCWMWLLIWWLSLLICMTFSTVGYCAEMHQIGYIESPFMKYIDVIWEKMKATRFNNGQKAILLTSRFNNQNRMENWRKKKKKEFNNSNSPACKTDFTDQFHCNSKIMVLISSKCMSPPCSQYAIHITQHNL